MTQLLTMTTTHKSLSLDALKGGQGLRDARARAGLKPETIGGLKLVVQTSLWKTKVSKGGLISIVTSYAGLRLRVFSMLQ